LYIHRLCAEFFYMPCPLRASKTFTLSFMVQVKQLGAPS